MSELWPSVIEAFPGFSKTFEGYVYSMYLDVKGLVTTGVGNLIDTPAEARKLPWKHDGDSQPATVAEIESAWHLLKSHQEYAHRSVAAARVLTGLHLDAADVDALVLDRLHQNATFLTAHHFDQFPIFPADAQLACMSLAWAVGAGWPTKFPHLAIAVRDQDWVMAPGFSDIHVGNPGEPGYNPGVAPRNRAQRACWSNALAVKSARGSPLGDPSVLHYPFVVSSLPTGNA